MIQAISRAERFNMLPEDYLLRKQFLLNDSKQELSLAISLMRNNPYSSDLLEYVKAIQMEINELGYFCILPNPSSPNAKEYYERTLEFLKSITEMTCRNLALDQYNGIDVFDTLGELVCKHANLTRDILIQFLPQKAQIEEEIRKYNKLKVIFSNAIALKALSNEDTDILNKYFIKYSTRIMELKQRIAL